VYVLTTNRKQSTYADILSKLVELEPDFKPPRAMVDFELAAINAINQQFEGVIAVVFFILRKTIGNIFNRVAFKHTTIPMLILL